MKYFDKHQWMILAMLVAMIIATPFFFAGTVSAIGAARAWPMVPVVLACWALGHLSLAGPNDYRGPEGSVPSFFVLMIILWMANSRGFYWSILDRGDGFWTLNRITANIVFLVAFVAPRLAAERRRRRRESNA